MDILSFLARHIDITTKFFSYLGREDQHHIAIIQYMKKNHPNVLILHCPTESKKSFFERYKYSLMGAVTGTSDFIILKPKYQYKRDGLGLLYRELLYHGMVLELKAPEEKVISKKGINMGKVVKRPEGKLSEKQVAFLDKCNDEKYYGTCEVGFQDAINEIEKYLKEPSKNV